GENPCSVATEFRRMNEACVSEREKEFARGQRPDLDLPGWADWRFGVLILPDATAREQAAAFGTEAKAIDADRMEQRWGNRLASFRVPNARGLVTRAAGHPTTVRAETNIGDHIVVAPPLEQFGAVLQSRSQAQPMHGGTRRIGFEA